MLNDRPSATGLGPGTPGRPKEAGFTLVEALCAIVILVFGLMAITNLMLVAATSNTVANQSTAATNFASQQLEVLKALPFPPGTGVAPVPTLPVVGTGVKVGDVDADTAGYFLDPPPEVPGVGQVKVRWEITGVDGQTVFIRVRAEGTGALTGARSRAEFTVFRSCTDTSLNCPPR